MNSHGIEVGERKVGNNKFKLFYNPLPPNDKRAYWFFWLMGRSHYVYKMKRHKCCYCGYKFADYHKFVIKPNGKRKKVYCCNLCYGLRER